MKAEIKTGFKTFLKMYGEGVFAYVQKIGIYRQHMTRVGKISNEPLRIQYLRPEYLFTKHTVHIRFQIERQCGISKGASGFPTVNVALT